MKRLLLAFIVALSASVAIADEDETSLARQKANELVIRFRHISPSLPLASDERKVIEETADWLYLHASYEPLIGSKKSKKQGEKSRQLLLSLMPLMDRLLTLLPEPKKPVFIAEYGTWFESPKEKETYRERLLKTYKENETTVLAIVHQIRRTLKGAPDLSEKLPKRKDERGYEPPYWSTDPIQHHAIQLLWAIKDNRLYHAGYHLSELLKWLKDCQAISPTR